jgi:hypothetical protein
VTAIPDYRRRRICEYDWRLRRRISAWGVTDLEIVSFGRLADRTLQFQEEFATRFQTGSEWGSRPRRKVEDRAVQTRPLDDVDDGQRRCWNTKNLVNGPDFVKMVVRLPILIDSVLLIRR